MSEFITGIVAFSNLLTPDVYKGKPTNKYSVVVTMNEQEAAKLEAQNVLIKEYEGNKQRKFATQFSFEVMDLEGRPFSQEIPYGSEVRVLYTLRPNEEYGMIPYLEKIRILELAEGAIEVPEDF